MSLNISKIDISEYVRSQEYLQRLDTQRVLAPTVLPLYFLQTCYRSLAVPVHGLFVVAYVVPIYTSRDTYDMEAIVPSQN